MPCAPTAGGPRPPIAELVEESAPARAAAADDGRGWADLSDAEQAGILDGHRLAYTCEAPVNWCPGLGTVLSNEEVTADGRSERGNFPVFKRNLRQWMMRITAYADRLVDDLDRVDWPETVKIMQRNWIGRSEPGRPCDVASPSTCADGDAALAIEVFTTRPDTLFGATFMVLAPEHPLVDAARRRRLAEATSRRGPAARRRPTRPSRPTGAPHPQDRRRAADRGQGQDRRLHRRASRPTRSTAQRSRCSSPTTC